jgi:hypothetical protein
MLKSREMMFDELNRVVVPALRELGFSGSLPQFRRASHAQIDLIEFQFLPKGDRFRVEISTFPSKECRATSRVLLTGEVTQPPLLSWRLLGQNEAPGDGWFSYEVESQTDVADSVLAQVRQQAIPWWASQGVITSV